jgi:hypothetical protein
VESDAGQTHVWSVETGQAVGAPRTHPERVTSIVFSPDGSWVVAGTVQGTAQCLLTETGQALGPPLRHRSPVRAVAISPDRRSILTGSGQGAARLWTVRPALESSAEAVLLALAAWTGIELDADGNCSILEEPTWSERRRRLAEADPLLARLADALTLEAAAWHSVHAGEAEQAGDLFAAAWQLDQLLQLEPRNWHHHARRARIHALSNQWEQAEAACVQAQRCADERLVDWYRHQLASCRAIEAWELARWFADRLIAAAPADAMAYLARSDVLERLGRGAESEADRSKAQLLTAVSDSDRE